MSSFGSHGPSQSLKESLAQQTSLLAASKVFQSWIQCRTAFVIHEELYLCMQRKRFADVRLEFVTEARPDLSLGEQRVPRNKLIPCVYDFHFMLVTVFVPQSCFVSLAYRANPEIVELWVSDGNIP